MDTLAQRLQASLGDAFTLERELGGGGHVARTANTVDSLVALEDSTMIGGGYVHSATFLHRLAIGRALTRAILHMSRFVDMVDRPPVATNTPVDAARARLATLTGDSRR